VGGHGSAVVVPGSRDTHGSDLARRDDALDRCHQLRRRAAGRHGIEQVRYGRGVADIDIDVHIQRAVGQLVRVEVPDAGAPDRGTAEQDLLSRVGVARVDEDDPALATGCRPRAAGSLSVPTPAASASGSPPR